MNKKQEFTNEQKEAMELPSKYNHTFLFIKKLNSSSSMARSILGTSFIHDDNVATNRE
jgi:hypothetical protein